MVDERQSKTQGISETNQASESGELVDTNM